MFYYFINLNERGDFNADIRNETDTTIFEISSSEELKEMVENGFISHCHDIKGLKEYLIDVNILPVDAELCRGNEKKLFY